MRNVGAGTWLLLAHMVNPLSVLTRGDGGSDYLSLSGPFLVAVMFVVVGTILSLTGI